MCLPVRKSNPFKEPETYKEVANQELFYNKWIRDRKNQVLRCTSETRFERWNKKGIRLVKDIWDPVLSTWLDIDVVERKLGPDTTPEADARKELLVLQGCIPPEWVWILEQGP